MNIQCLTNKMDILNAYLYLLNFSVICICEHWMQIEEIKCTVLEGFTVASFFTRSNLKNGGTIIFVKKDINFTSSNLSEYVSESHFEASGIYLNQIKLQIINIYIDHQVVLLTYFMKN